MLTLIIPASKPNKLELLRFLAVNGTTLFNTFTKSILELKKLFTPLLGVSNAVPFIIKRSPVKPKSPSKEENANFALTGPTGMVVNPEIGIFNPPVELIELNPSNNVIFLAVARGSSYTTNNVQPAEVFAVEPAIKLATP